MLKMFVTIFAFFLIVSCKPCRECKYSTLKGVEVERSCSSIKEDRIAFEERMDSTAKYFGSSITCTKEGY